LDCLSEGIGLSVGLWEVPTVCFKVRVLRLERARRNKEQGICCTCSREEDWSHISKSEGTKIWRHETLGKIYRKICAEIRIKR
jgi:hypothetical protein